MLDGVIGELLPAAAAVALSPFPIVAVVLVLQGAGARARGLAFAVGWIVGLAALSTLIVVVAEGVADPGTDAATGVDWFMAAVGLGLLALAAKQWTKRPRAGEAPTTPAWMATIDSLSVWRSLGLGAALAGANPKNVALTLAASATIAHAELDATDTAIAIAVFVVLGSLSVVGAVVAYVLAPHAAQRPLTAVKDFMIANNATIMMVIFLIFGVKVLGDAIGGAWS